MVGLQWLACSLFWLFWPGPGAKSAARLVWRRPGRQDLWRRPRKGAGPRKGQDTWRYRGYAPSFRQRPKAACGWAQRLPSQLHLQDGSAWGCSADADCKLRSAIASVLLNFCLCQRLVPSASRHILLQGHARPGFQLSGRIDVIYGAPQKEWAAEEAQSR